MALRASTVSCVYFWKALPAAVSETLPPERSKSLAPTSSSRARIWEEMAGWVRKRFSAARENEAWRATSRKVWSWSKSMGQRSVASGRWPVKPGIGLGPRPNPAKYTASRRHPQRRRREGCCLKILNKGRRVTLGKEGFKSDQMKIRSGGGAE